MSLPTYKKAEDLMMGAPAKMSPKLRREPSTRLVELCKTRA
jgi:hypothetical protein